MRSAARGASGGFLAPGWEEGSAEEGWPRRLLAVCAARAAVAMAAASG